MRHIEAIDTDRRVVMVQVENEVGLLGDSRDRSPAAEAAWRAPVPRALLDRLAAHPPTPELAALWAPRGRRRAGSWPENFGTSPQAEEAFMA